MISAGETAPDSAASLVTADGELTETQLSDWFDDAPLVVACFLAAVSATCTDEVGAIQSIWSGRSTLV